MYSFFQLSCQNFPAFDLVHEINLSIHSFNPHFDPVVYENLKNNQEQFLSVRVLVSIFRDDLNIFFVVERKLSFKIFNEDINFIY
ncbi:hypothetical protein BpHYR1_037671 [Brachionus plicatilis]|uniref:Uncharacterized protein n=1 Tax=Brachionus plicatilis TaxID=10195 RepID=A0A3M7P6N8_BRAPC|nr:hypothetical protein BpHYR1_037671 [Brachionus plicatilis]